MPLMDFIRALSPTAPAAATPNTIIDTAAAAGKLKVERDSPSPNLLKKRPLSSAPHTNYKGLSPSSDITSHGIKKQEGDKTWERAWEMKRMLKATVRMCALSVLLGSLPLLSRVSKEGDKLIMCLPSGAPSTHSWRRA